MIKSNWLIGCALLLCGFSAGCEDLQSDSVPKVTPDMGKQTVKENEGSIEQAYEKGLEIGKQMEYKQGSEAIPEVAEAIIKGKVHAGLKAAEVDRSGFEVIVEDGVIVLQGKVASETQKAKAEGVAAGVIGSKKKVKNKLSVEG